jgi:hypothetical protein
MEWWIEWSEKKYPDPGHFYDQKKELQYAKAYAWGYASASISWSSEHASAGELRELKRMYRMGEEDRKSDDR